MLPQNNNDLRDKILEGLKLSAKKMLEEKKKNNQQIVISVDGEIKIINARDLK